MLHQGVPPVTGFKHADANGNGFIKVGDLYLNELHFGRTVDFYAPVFEYPVGDELVIDFKTSPKPLTASVIFCDVATQIEIDDVYGVAFTLDFDESLFSNVSLSFHNPFDTDSVLGYAGSFENPGYTAVLINHQSGVIPANKDLLSFILYPNPSVPDENPPDSTIIRLENLTAIDADGNEIEIGANEFVIYKELMTTGIGLEDIDEIKVYPNPATDQLTIESANPTEVDYEIYSMSGRSISQDQIPGRGLQQIDLSRLENGLYLLCLRTPSGEQWLKFVKGE